MVLATAAPAFLVRTVHLLVVASILAALLVGETALAVAAAARASLGKSPAEDPAAGAAADHRSGRPLATDQTAADVAAVA